MIFFLHAFEIAAVDPDKDPAVRGAFNRNAGLKWIVENASKDGVMYFADDDNAYDLRLFKEVQF